MKNITPCTREMNHELRDTRAQNRLVRCQLTPVLAPAVWPRSFSPRSNPMSYIASPLSRSVGWSRPLYLFSATSWHFCKNPSHPPCETGRRRHAWSAGKASGERECIRPLASTEASINEQPGNVSIQTHSAPGCRGRPGHGHRRLGDMNNWGPCFKCLNELGPWEEVLRDVQEGGREWLQKYSHYVFNHEEGRCSVSVVKTLSPVISGVAWVRAGSQIKPALTILETDFCVCTNSGK